jgi:hypothetical protein
MEEYQEEQGLNKTEALELMIRDSLRESARLTAALAVSATLGVVWCVLVVGVVFGIEPIRTSFQVTTIIGGVHIGSTLVIAGWPHLKPFLPLPERL